MSCLIVTRFGMMSPNLLKMKFFVVMGRLIPPHGRIGLEMMSTVREQTSTRVVTNHYVEFLSSL